MAVTSTASKYVGGQLNFYDKSLNPTAPAGLWAECPTLAIAADPSLAHTFFDDMYVAPLDANITWLEIDDGTTGTNAVTDGAGGLGNVITAAADNDYHAISSRSEAFLFAEGKKLWLEVRFKLTEATTNESAWWFGLTDDLTTGGFQPNANGPLASYDGAMVWKDEGTLAIDFETSNAGTQNTSTAEATFVSGTFTKVGFYFDGTATTSVVTPYYNVSGTNEWTKGTAQNITLSGLEEMHLVAGVKAGPTAAAETLTIDYIKVVQLR